MARSSRRPAMPTLMLHVDHDGDLDLGGGDHLGVDPLRREHLEHARCDAGVRAHPDAHDRHFRDVELAAHAQRADLAWRRAPRARRRRCRLRRSASRCRSRWRPGHDPVRDPRGLALAATAADALVLYQKRKGSVFVRDACRKKGRPVDVASLGPLGPEGTPGTAGGTGPAGDHPLKLVDTFGTELGAILALLSDEHLRRGEPPAAVGARRVPRVAGRVRAQHRRRHLVRLLRQRGLLGIPCDPRAVWRGLRPTISIRAAIPPAEAPLTTMSRGFTLASRRLPGKRSIRRVQPCAPRDHPLALRGGGGGPAAATAPSPPFAGRGESGSPGSRGSPSPARRGPRAPHRGRRGSA